MNRVLKRFYERLKLEPCIVCGRYGVDIAHLRPLTKPLGSYSGGPYRNWGARSHKGEPAFTAIPLCRVHHERVHALGEKWLDEALEGRGGRRYAYAYALRILAEAVLEECEEEASTEEKGPEIHTLYLGAAASSPAEAVQNGAAEGEGESGPGIRGLTGAET